MIEVGFINAKSAAVTMPWVWGFNLSCKHTISLVLKNISLDRATEKPSLLAFCRLLWRPQTKGLAPNALPRWHTCLPMRPKPYTPNTLPASWSPKYPCHCPLFKRSTSSTSLRKAARMRSILSSAVAPPEPLPSITTIPFSLHASRSTWDAIFPVCEIIFNFGRRSSNSLVMTVLSRIKTIASASL